MFKSDELVLAGIKQHISENGISPTVKELAFMLGKFPSFVHVCIERLEADGYIERIPRKHRGIALTGRE